MQAGGNNFYTIEEYKVPIKLTDDTKDYVRLVTSLGNFSLKDDHTAEHSHECCGVHWPVVLPSDVVLAGRILVKYVKQQRRSGVDPSYHGILVQL